MNSTIYDHFSVVNCGVLDDTNALHLAEKYQDLSNNTLKSRFKNLKKSNAETVEIQYVARPLWV